MCVLAPPLKGGSWLVIGTTWTGREGRTDWWCLRLTLSAAAAALLCVLLIISPPFSSRVHPRGPYLLLFFYARAPPRHTKKYKSFSDEFDHSLSIHTRAPTHQPPTRYDTPYKTHSEFCQGESGARLVRHRIDTKFACDGCVKVGSSLSCLPLGCCLDVSRHFS